MLSVLVGEPLSDMWRPFGQAFEFAEQIPHVNRRGEDVTFAALEVTFTSTWHVMRESVLVMGSGDHDYPKKKRRFYDRQTPPRKEPERQRWKEAQTLLAKVVAAELIVQSVSADRYGQVEIRLSRGYAIRNFIVSVRDELLHFANRRTGYYGIIDYSDGQMLLTYSVRKPETRASQGF